MQAFKTLGAGIGLTLVLAVTTLAGETSTPPCSNDPGQTSTPPCSSAPITNDGSTAPGETSTPPTSDSVDLVTIGEIALDMLTFF